MRLLQRTTLLFSLALAACVAPVANPPIEPPAGSTPLADAQQPIREVRYVEASGPPVQDPDQARQRAGEDPQDPTVRLEAAHRELERQQSLRREAEATIDSIRGRVRDLEARVLSLTLERAMMEQEVLQLRIDALRGELQALEPAPGREPR